MRERQMRFLQLPASKYFLLLIFMFVAILIYLPGLYGDFEFDDSINILENPALKLNLLSREKVLSAAVSGKSGPLGRPISMLSFGVNYYFTGFEPFFLKFTNLLIHVMVGSGVYMFVYHLTMAVRRSGERQEVSNQASVVALTTAGLWLVHPLNVTSVLYVVQRMTSLAALFTFFALALYVLGRRKMLGGQTVSGIFLVLVALGPMTALAALSKETGVLVPYLMLCIELTVFRFLSPEKRSLFFLKLFFSAIVFVPLALAMFNIDRLSAFVASGYLQRDFTLSDRLLTQPQVLMFYLRLLLIPNAGSMGIYHDDFPISASLTQSPGTLVSISLILFLIAVSIFSLRKAPALSTGILLFFVGHSVESTFLALEMVHEHRNYVPIVGPIFVAAFYFWHPGFTTLTTSAKWSIVFVALAVFGAVTYVRAMEWSNLVDHAAIEVHNHPDSNRTNYQMGRIYFMLYSNDKQIELAKLADKYFIRAAELGGDNVYPDVARLLIAYKARIEPDPGLIEKIAKRLRYGRPWEPNMGALNNLVNCQMTQYCKLADADMIALLLSALANPNASRKTMGTAHSLLGGYYALKLENIQQASGHIKAAVEAEPDRIEYRLDLVRLYGASGDIEAAKSELAAARKLDVWALHTQRFDAEAALLDSALKSRSG